MVAAPPFPARRKTTETPPPPPELRDYTCGYEGFAKGVAKLSFAAFRQGFNMRGARESLGMMLELLGEKGPAPVRGDWEVLEERRRVPTALPPKRTAEMERYSRQRAEGDKRDAERLKELLEPGLASSSAPRRPPMAERTASGGGARAVGSRHVEALPAGSGGGARPQWKDPLPVKNRDSFRRTVLPGPAGPRMSFNAGSSKT